MNRQWLAHLPDFLIHHNIRHIVLSPGSRSAPLVLHLANHRGLTVHVRVDERSAGFIALGLAQHLQAPVALVCTSGSALLNYAPAVAEAYYQRIPLLILSADRPPEWIDQADGQSMRQHNVFNNFIRLSKTLPVDTQRKEDEWLLWRTLSEAARATIYPAPGPVHVNIPFREPLYVMEEKAGHVPKFIDAAPSSRNLTEEAFDEILDRLQNSKRVMVVVGLLPPQKNIAENFNKLAQLPQVIILSDITSNNFGENIHPASDDFFASLPIDDFEYLKPEIILSLGEAVISKRMKEWQRKFPSAEHLHLAESMEAPDTFQSLAKILPCNGSEFIHRLSEKLKPNFSDYAQRWKMQREILEISRQRFFKNIPFSDLSTINTISKKVPENSQLHFANSMPIRYAQFFDWSRGCYIFSNRGVSGIDGCVSTAVGSALEFDGFTTVITGDLAMLYDSHALWGKLPNRFRMIVLNNGGGGIFRIIDGPGKYPEFRDFFETPNSISLKLMTEMYNVEYQSAKTEVELSEALNSFYNDDNRPKLLEVFTDQETNAQEFKRYIKSVTTNNL